MVTSSKPRVAIEGENKCSLCRSARLGGTFHCDMCDECVEGYDHHCGVTMICIGKKNIKYFLQMFWYTSLTFVYKSVALGVTLAIINKSDEETSKEGQIAGGTFSYGAIIVFALFGLCMLFMAGSATISTI